MRITKREEYRSNLIEERIPGVIDQWHDHDQYAGARAVSQVNGVAVIDLGGYPFGKPVAHYRPGRLSGRGWVQSIEREIELSGPIHSKGFLILSGYLAGRTPAPSRSRSAATITFEQSYDEVEGDSASSTELYALLSALAGLHCAQRIAVTGSVNQQGELQAVGGVTPKIEGFFTRRKAKGLTGRTGHHHPGGERPQPDARPRIVIDAVRDRPVPRLGRRPSTRASSSSPASPTAVARARRRVPEEQRVRARRHDIRALRAPRPRVRKLTQCLPRLRASQGLITHKLRVRRRRITPSTVARVPSKWLSISAYTAPWLPRPGPDQNASRSRSGTTRPERRSSH